ncbi:MAG: hypothetical protein U9N85_12035 [Bacteroidota bacterium]|nr:hypothetical protein [Bacteroidota bacterium]
MAVIMDNKEKQMAEQEKQITELSIQILEKYKRNINAGAKISNEDRQSIIKNIAAVKLYKNLLKDQSNYTAKMKKQQNE